MEGQQSTPLSHLGQQQALRLSQSLIDPSLLAPGPSPLTNPLQNPPPNPLRTTKALPTHLYSSPLLRATQTATALQQTLQTHNHPLSIQHTEDLQEMHPGIFQGLTWAEAIAHYPDLCDRLMTSLEWQPVPQAESLVEARTRAQSWVNQMLSKHAPGDTIWAVSHAGLMLHIIAVIMGCDRTWKVTLPHTTIFEFWLQSTHWQTLGQDRFNPEYWILRRFNDTAHLNTTKG